MVRPYLRILAVAPLLLAPRPARAQRETFTNWNAWFTLNGDVAFTERWGVLFDGSIRRSGPLKEPQAAFARAALTYTVSEHVRVGAGVVRAESYPFGKIPSAYQAPEWRGFQQIVLSHDLGPLGMSHRYRLEQRWRGRRPDDGSSHAIDHWMRSSRFRYQVRATMPLRGPTVDPGEWYVTAANEMFIGFGANVQNNVFDQNRALVAAGRRLRGGWRTEVGFLEHVVFKSNGRDVERNHTVTMSLSYTRVPPVPARHTQ